jgi:hypothetical protein
MIERMGLYASKPAVSPWEVTLALPSSKAYDFLADPRFNDELKTDPTLYLRLLFHIRKTYDISVFRSLYRTFLNTMPDFILWNLESLPKYGSWGDVVDLFVGTIYEDRAVELIASQLTLDRDRMSEGKPVSSCAYYAPSEGRQGRVVQQICRELMTTPKQYRKNYLTPLRQVIRNTPSVIPEQDPLFSRVNEARKKATVDIEWGTISGFVPVIDWRSDRTVAIGLMMMTPDWIPFAKNPTKHKRGYTLSGTIQEMGLINHYGSTDMATVLSLVPNRTVVVLSANVEDDPVVSDRPLIWWNINVDKVSMEIDKKVIKLHGYHPYFLECLRQGKPIDRGELAKRIADDYDSVVGLNGVKTLD